VVAAGFVVYGAYGDPHPKPNQESAVPFLIGVAAVVAAVVFAGLVPKALRAIREERTTAARWGLAHSLVALVLTPMGFWSGLPLIVGTAGAWLGRRTREQREAAGSPTGTATAAVVIGGLAVALTLLIGILGNTVLAHS
jgi:MFS family permease